MPEFDGAVLSAFSDSVVAMMNYRVGAFGFLNLRDENIKGNMGMFDQVSQSSSRGTKRVPSHRSQV